jgi:subtilisin family serine protease
MKKLHLKRVCAVVLGTALILPFAQADEMLVREHDFTRPAAKGPINLPDRSKSGDVDVFVRFSEPSVSELNIETFKLTGRMADSKSQKRQADKVSAQQKAMRSELLGFGVKEVSALRVGANGVHIRVDPRMIDDIEGLRGVLSVAPVAKHELDNAESVPWIGAPAVWDAIGTGEGVSIGIIDTGIDYQHMNFGGDGSDSFPTAKVVGGYDFVGDDYTGGNDPVPDEDPLDCGGHGTHVAGTAAGLGVEGNIGPGVAKGADLYALKVFGCEGYTLVTAQAIEWAMDPNGDGDMSDHLDVINMSLGSQFGDPNDPSAISSNHAAELGIIVATSAGNSGDVPYITGSPGVASKAISTAASGKPQEVLAVEFTGDWEGSVEAIEGSSPAQLSAGPVSGLLVQDPDNIIGCGEAGFAVDMTDGIALISRGGCTFDEKFWNAQQAGAIGVIVYNDGTDAGRIAPIFMGGIGSTYPVTIPGVMIPATNGFELSGALGEGAAINALMDESLTTPTAFVDVIQGFSSRGPGNGGSGFKPDVTNPGAAIVSAAVGTVDQGVAFWGTSMASPHTAGVGALLRQQHPDLDTSAIKALMQNSTEDVVIPIPLSRQGVGRVDAANAMALGSYAAPGGVSFGRMNPASQTKMKHTVMVTDISGSVRKFVATHIPNQQVPGVSVSCDRFVKVPANGTRKFNISISITPMAMLYDYPSFTQTEVDGWCVLDDGEDTLRVGYMAVIDPASRMKATWEYEDDMLLVQNYGGQAAGFAWGFTLTGRGGLLMDGTSHSIDAVGYRTTEYGPWPVMEFAYAAEKAWEAPSNLQWEIYLDTDKDGADDVLLVALDGTYVADFFLPGEMITLQVDLASGAAFLDWFIQDLDYNDRVMSMPFTRDPDGWVTDSFNYTMVVYGRDGTIDVQFGSVDTANEIVPEESWLGFFGGGGAKLEVSGPGGDMLWLFPSNMEADQVQTVTVD